MSDLKEIDREKLADLLAKVQAATGPSIEIDAAICVLEVPRMAEVLPHWSAAQQEDLLTHYTASIDAALALVERLFGVDDDALCYSYDLGWHASAHAGMAFTADLHLAVGKPAVMKTTHGQAATLPLAILAALLSALSSNPSDTE